MILMVVLVSLSLSRSSYGTVLGLKSTDNTCEYVTAYAKLGLGSIVGSSGIFTSNRFCPTFNYPKKDAPDGPHVFAIIGFVLFSSVAIQREQRKNQEQENVSK